MKTLTLFVLGLALLASPAWAFCDHWQTEDTVVSALASLATVADWSQTRQIASAPTLYETNGLLGHHPPAQDVNLYFTGALAGMFTVGCVLDGPQRTVWFSAWALVEAFYVQHNIALGVRVGF